MMFFTFVRIPWHEEVFLEIAQGSLYLPSYLDVGKI